jgi:acyl carrier protein
MLIVSEQRIRGENMPSKDDLTRAILQIIGETLAAKDLSTQGLGLDSPVDSSLGLDSLDWAAVVVRIELETGVDPFAEGIIGRLKTVSEPN